MGRGVPRPPSLTEGTVRTTTPPLLVSFCWRVTDFLFRKFNGAKITGPGEGEKNVISGLGTKAFIRRPHTR